MPHYFTLTVNYQSDGKQYSEPAEPVSRRGN